jgi:hypothetical protein
MSLINFLLKDPATIVPLDEIDWFVLTEGAYWFDLEGTFFYELAEVAGNENPAHSSRFADYNVARLAEDFAELFESIGEPVPADLYDLVKNDKDLFALYDKANEKADELADAGNEEALERLQQGIGWIHCRTLTAMHLADTPTISFFRNENRLSIVWNAAAVLENDNPVWTAGVGSLEMDYVVFVAELNNFKDRFFAAMEAQITAALPMKWKKLTVDSKTCMAEQQAREKIFTQKLDFLSSAAVANETNWAEARQTINELL